MAPTGLAFGLRSILADMRPAEFSRFRRVAAAQELPRSPRRPRAVAGPLGMYPRVRSGEKIWAVTTVRDEADIIGYTVAHLVSQGVDRVLVADNNSVDDTARILAELSASMPVTIVRDREPAHYQAQKMTRLARYAACSGAEWVIPFDADELWVAPAGRLREFLAATPHDVVRARLIDYVPDPADDPAEDNPYRRIRHHLAEPGNWSKVAFRAMPTARVAAGNHTVRHPGVVGRGLEIRHFPNRTPEQLRRKLQQGSEALAATDHVDGIGEHWRKGAELDDEGQARSFGWGKPLVMDPAPYTGVI